MTGSAPTVMVRFTLGWLEAKLELSVSVLHSQVANKL